MNEWLLILGMMVVTFGIRYPVLALLSRVELPASLLRALTFVPVAVLSAIVVPMALVRDGDWAVSYDNPFLTGTLFAVLVGWKTRNLLITILSGMGFFVLLQWVL